MNEKLARAMREWSAEAAELGPPPSVEQAVLAEFDRSIRAKRRRQWSAIAVTAAAVLTLVVWTREPRPVDVVEPDPAVDFIALPYVIQPAQYERIEVLRMSVPVAELIAAGLRVQADPGELVEADVLFGQDRRARAVRIIYQ